MIFPPIENLAHRSEGDRFLQTLCRAVFNTRLDNPDNNEPYPVLCKRLLIITFRFSSCWRLRAVAEKGLRVMEDMVRSGSMGNTTGCSGRLEGSIYTRRPSAIYRSAPGASYAAEGSHFASPITNGDHELMNARWPI
jgi:hypothetical protein